MSRVLNDVDDILRGGHVVMLSCYSSSVSVAAHGDENVKENACTKTSMFRTFHLETYRKLFVQIGKHDAPVVLFLPQMHRGWHNSSSPTGAGTVYDCVYHPGRCISYPWSILPR